MAPPDWPATIVFLSIVIVGTLISLTPPIRHQIERMLGDKE